MSILPAMVSLISLCAGTTAPTSSPARQETLSNGAIRFFIPDGLTLLGKRTDDLSASVAPSDNSALITLVVAPQQHTVEDALATKLGKLVIETINAQAAKGEIESIEPPKIEKDSRVMLRIHDRFRTKGKTCDRVQLYRGLGKYLISVTATSFSEDKEATSCTHKEGEALIASVALNRATSVSTAPATKPARPASAQAVTFPNARIRVTPPPGWTGQTNLEASSGILASWRDPLDGNNLIAVSARQIPTEARSDPKLRDAIIDEIVAGEKQAFVIDGAEPRGQTRTIPDKRFLRKTRTDYEAKGLRFQISARQIRVGDAIVSVTMVALDEQADAIDALADKVAVDANALGAVRN